MSAGLGFFGFAFALLSGFLFYTGMAIDTSGGQAVVNLQLLQVQSNIYATAIGAGLVAALFFIGASIVGAIDDLKTRAPTPGSVQP